MIVDTMKLENRSVAVEPERISRNGRRFFSEAHKRAVVEKCLIPGASVSAIALAHGFNTNLVRKWIVNYQSHQGLGGSIGRLVPVGVIEAGAKPTKGSKRTAGKRAPERASGWIEIQIGAVRVMVRGKVEAGELRVVLEALGAWR
jgi:transposase